MTRLTWVQAAYDTALTGITCKFEPIAQMRDAQLVAVPERRPSVDALAVDPCTVRTAQVANDDLVVAHRQAAIAPRDARRVDPDVAVVMAADDGQDAGQVDIRVAA